MAEERRENSAEGPGAYQARDGLWWRVQELLAVARKEAGEARGISDSVLRGLSGLRTSAGRTRADLAALLGLSAKAVQNTEEGVSANPATVIRYLECLSVDLQRIFLRPGAAPSWIVFPEKAWDPKWQAPSALLDPVRRVVRFEGIKPTECLDRLVAWCLSPEDVGVLSFQARGGMGKTRLGVELCHRIREKSGDGDSPDWICGFLHTGRFPKDGSPWESTDLSESSVLVVVDYAGSADKLAVLKRLLPALNPAPAKRFRLLLLDRSDYWLAELRRDPDCAELLRGKKLRRAFSAPEPMTGLDPDERTRMFETALDGFRSKLRRHETAARIPDLRSPVFERTLLVHMKALLAAEADPCREELEDEILESILNRERRQWEKGLIARRLGADLLPVVEKVYWKLNAMGGAKTRSLAQTNAKRVATFHALPPHLQAGILDVLHDCYRDAGVFLTSLQPDLLGEHFIAKPPKATPKRRG